MEYLFIGVAFSCIIWLFRKIIGTSLQIIGGLIILFGSLLDYVGTISDRFRKRRKKDLFLNPTENADAGEVGMERSHIQSINPYDYEEYVAQYLRANGYTNVYTTKKSGDFGADVIATNPDGLRVCVQCKRFVGSVGVKAIQEIHSAKAYYNCDLACVYTTGDYTPQAFDLAERTGVKLYKFIPGATNRASSLRAGSRSKTLIGTGFRILAVIVAIVLVRSCLTNRKTSNTAVIENEVIDTGAENDENQIVALGNDTDIDVSDVQDNQVWLTPDLQDFDYYYENHGITLKSYKGDATSIIIPASFTVESSTIPVLKLEGTFRKNSNMVNIAISEGINRITYDTFFQCSELKRLLIPSTVHYIGTLLENVGNEGDFFFYGGTEQQWDSIPRPIRSQITFKTIKYCATIEDCAREIDAKIDYGYIEMGCSPLNAFSFDIRNGKIHLKEYLGEEKTVRIQSLYLIDDEERMVFGLDDTFKNNSSVETVVIPDGVNSLGLLTFSGSKVECVYLPKSIEEVPLKLWRYFPKLKAIYYGGTEEEFIELISGNRRDVEGKKIVYNASPLDCVGG